MRDPHRASDRATLLRELERYAPSDARERAMADRLRAFVADHDTCFERTSLLGHVTGSAWIVDRALDAALLLHHRKLDKWLQPGGHADGDPDIRRVALREATEETGMVEIVFASDEIFDIDVHAIPARGEEPAHDHFDVRFAFYADARIAPIVSAESHDVKWIPFTEIERYTIDDSVRRLIAKTVSLKR